ncbi:hypothetical protein [Phyllobacterium leguminum]|uniref:hypothetical protein n=1 Tax=Phyllobacterium leguminum TaxID=314237 RepID=UPI0015E8777D|nr:hypothetical protein [Phyllobacterium leguminum]
MKRLRAFDPRDGTQLPDDPSTWLLTANEALIKASRVQGVQPISFWRGVAILATIWDDDHMPRVKE